MAAKMQAFAATCPLLMSDCIIPDRTIIHVVFIFKKQSRPGQSMNAPGWRREKLTSYLILLDQSTGKLLRGQQTYLLLSAIKVLSVQPPQMNASSFWNRRPQRGTTKRQGSPKTYLCITINISFLFKSHNMVGIFQT